MSFVCRLGSSLKAGADARLRPHRFFLLCFASGVRMIFGAGFEKKKKKKKTPPYVHVHAVHVCCDFFWFNRKVLVMDARQHASSSHDVHCDLHSARNCASSSLQPSSGHGTGLHVQYATWFSSFCFFSVVCFFPFFLFFFRTPSLCFWLADPARNIEKNTVRP